jgi:hypothetical protein
MDHSAQSRRSGRIFTDFFVKARKLESFEARGGPRPISGMHLSVKDLVVSLPVQ